MRLRLFILAALSSAALFGASTPLARALIGRIDPLWLAGLLYAGSGLGLALVLALRRLQPGASAALFVAPGDRVWLAAAILCGGIVAPVLFTYGLRDVGGATASLLLNLEMVLTVLLAWFVFREHRSARVVAGMALIAIACVVLSANGGDKNLGGGAALIALACLGWALDNNFTRRIAGNDAVLIAALKGLSGGTVNLGLAALFVGSTPEAIAAIAAGAVGFLSYGVSLVLFVIALRNLGTARTSAYFSAAPFIGALVAFALLGERPDATFWIAAPLMAIGVWLHLTEHHGHEHTHEPLAHTHSHRHDDHHRHAHDFAWDGTEPHVHAHVHDPLTHAHPHFPDLHHRHRH